MTATFELPEPLEPVYPDVLVPMIGEDSNAFAIVGRVARALRQAGAPESDVKTFADEAMSSDFDHLLATVCRWVAVS